MPEENLTTALTFGQKAVGLDFNPGGDPLVHDLKRRYADLIDDLNSLRGLASPEVARMLSVAITEAQTSQMWAIKGITWKY